MKESYAADAEQPPLSRQERRVVAFADQDPLSFATSTAAEVARVTSTSEATVARAAKKVGFSSTKAMKLAYARRVERSKSLSGITQGRLEALAQDPSEGGGTAESILTSSAGLLLQLQETLTGDILARLVDNLLQAPRVLVYGLGTAEYIARHFSLDLERVGVASLPLTGSGHTNADAVARVRSEDAVVVLAPRRIFSDVENFLGSAAAHAGSTTVVTQDDLPRSVHNSVLRIELPLTFEEAGSESVAAWAFCDVVIAEIVRRRPREALEARSRVQELRERYSPGGTRSGQ